MPKEMRGVGVQKALPQDAYAPVPKGPDYSEGTPVSAKSFAGGKQITITRKKLPIGR